MLTWPLASTAIVVLTVALSLGWYERSRPTPRLVALVATMAALAVVGRIAFAPIPNVKPTTDLILLAGLAFGAVPGFAVGATTALVSNLFFGQGLHTPWQMLAWGGVGLLGALAGRALGERPSRWPIAALCAFAGFAFGAFMDFSLWATVGGQHTLAEYWAISLRGLPFNIAHAAGNAAFAIAFAPVVLAALARARARTNVTILPIGGDAAASGPSPARRGIPAGAALTLAAGLAVGGTLAAPGDARAASATPVDYLLAHQATSGGFGDGGGAGTLESGWAAMALGASPGVPDAARRKAISYLRTSAQGVTDPGDLERIMLGLGALGAPARDSAGRDLAGALLSQQAADGSFAGLVNQTAFAVLALRSAGRSRSSKPIKRATAYLLSKANTDGGFSYSGKGGSGVDDTAGVVQALAAAGRRGAKATTRATAFIISRQLPDGGFPIGSESRSNAQSTAWATQALLSVRKNPAKVKSGGNSPISFLKSLIVADGHVRYSRTSDQTPVWATAQAQLALAGSPLPVVRATRASASAAAARDEDRAARRTARERRTRAARRERRLAKRTAHRAELAETFSDDVLAPTTTVVMVLAGVFRLG
jgi:uncharacterized membrane protein